MQALRNTLYIILQLTLTPIWAFLICITFWMSPKARNEL